MRRGDAIRWREAPEAGRPLDLAGGLLDCPATEGEGAPLVPLPWDGEYTGKLGGDRMLCWLLPAVAGGCACGLDSTGVPRLDTCVL